MEAKKSKRIAVTLTGFLAQMYTRRINMCQITCYSFSPQNKHANADFQQVSRQKWDEPEGELFLTKLSFHRAMRISALEHEHPNSTF